LLSEAYTNIIEKVKKIRPTIDEIETKDSLHLFMMCNYIVTQIDTDTESI